MKPAAWGTAAALVALSARRRRPPRPGCGAHSELSYLIAIA